MIKRFLCLVVGLTFLGFAQPKEEVRAVWLTTVYGLDWPKTSGQSSQKTEMINMLNKLKEANFNTIMFQVRARGDLMYPSQIEPWARSLTNILGQNPGWDPLQFVIDEAKARGMEVHAWWNVYLIYNGTALPPVTNPLHIIRKHPELVNYYEPSNSWFLDPGQPGTKEYLVNLGMELVRKYDIDAIHFDYIRYPNPDFNDDSTYILYSQGVNKDDWRRNNITQFVYEIYDSIQAVKPNVKVGSAPIGIYKNIEGASGWQGFSSVYQDSRRWLLAQKHDYLSPQIYWDIATNPRYTPLVKDWVLNRAGRHIYAGVAVYRMAPSDGNWPASEVLAQVDTSRAYNAQGQTYFRTQSFTDNYKSIFNLIKANQYKYPANIPPMPWKDNIKPNSPVNLTLTTTDSLAYTLAWEKPAPAADGDTAIYFNVYMDTISPVNIDDIKNVIHFRVVNDTSISYTFSEIPTSNYFFTVTAYDKFYNESDPADEAGIIIVGITDDMIASTFMLEQNYPNPFNPSTVINFELPAEHYVTLKIYDLLGREIAVLLDGQLTGGKHSVQFSTADYNLSSGVYIYTINAGDFISSKKMMLIR